MPLSHAELLKLKRWNTPVSRGAFGRGTPEVSADMKRGDARFRAAARHEFGKPGEF